MRHWLEEIFFLVERILTALLYPCYLAWDRAAGRVRIPILMYHQVSGPLPGVKSCQDCVSPEAFEVQMRALRGAGYRVIPLATLVQLLDALSIRELKRCVVLTFDDGFRDHYANAYPVLRRYGFPATFFVIAGYTGENAYFPHLSLDESLRGGGSRPPAGWLPLSWDEAAEMAANGMEIASHALSHRSLGCMRPDEVEAEVCESKDILERRLGGRVDFFAYPFGSLTYGDFDRGIQDVLRRAGYRGACTSAVGRNAVGTDPFALRRIPMEETDGPFRLRCKLVGAYDWVGLVKTLWQRLIPREDRVDGAWRAEPGGGN